MHVVDPEKCTGLQAIVTSSSLLFLGMEKNFCRLHFLNKCQSLFLEFHLGLQFSQELKWLMYFSNFVFLIKVGECVATELLLEEKA